jgi:hypothetical protein
LRAGRFPLRRCRPAIPAHGCAAPGRRLRTTVAIGCIMAAAVLVPSEAPAQSVPQPDPYPAVSTAEASPGTHPMPTPDPVPAQSTHSNTKAVESGVAAPDRSPPQPAPTSGAAAPETSEQPRSTAPSATAERHAPAPKRPLHAHRTPRSDNPSAQGAKKGKPSQVVALGRASSSAARTEPPIVAGGLALLALCLASSGLLHHLARLRRAERI